MNENFIERLFRREFATVESEVCKNPERYFRWLKSRNVLPTAAHFIAEKSGVEDVLTLKGEQIYVYVVISYYLGNDSDQVYNHKQKMRALKSN